MKITSAISHHQPLLYTELLYSGSITPLQSTVSLFVAWDYPALYWYRDILTKAPASDGLLRTLGCILTIIPQQIPANRITVPGG